MAVIIIVAAIFNSVWTAMSQKVTKRLPMFESAIVFRLISLVFLFPLFVIFLPVPSSPMFFLAAVFAGFFEILLLFTLFKGFENDYYTTYGLFNASPILVLLASPIIFGDFVTLTQGVGVVITVAGGLVFAFRGKKNVIWGLYSCVLTALSIICSKWAMSYLEYPFGYPFVLFFTGILIFILLKPLLLNNVVKILKTSKKKFILPAFISFIATMGYYIATNYGNLVVIYTLFRVSLVSGIVLSYFYLKEKRDIKYKILAGVLIMFGTILIFF